MAQLLANHGAVTVADTMARAYMLAQILEDGARTACLARQVGTVQEIPAKESAALFEKMIAIAYACHLAAV